MKKNKNKPTVRLRAETLENRRLLASDVLDVSIENLAPNGGLNLTPAFVAFHDGDFRVARLGRFADAYPGLEAIAEEGDVTGLQARFDAANPDGVDAVLAAPGGFAGAPVIEPGETASATITVTDSEVNRFFSYASMIIPSNDAFIANVNSRSVSAFDSNGDFRGPITIEIFGRDILDSGTEVNNATGGAAFSTEGGESADEMNRIRAHRGLDEFIGTGLPTGENLQSSYNGRTPIARITIQANGGGGAADRHGPTTSGGGERLATEAAFTEFDVTYTDPSGIDVDSIDGGDLLVVGRRGVQLRVDSVTTDAAPGSSPTTVTATYRISKVDGGNFTLADNGIYRVFANRLEVFDDVGNAAQRREIGQFEIGVTPQLQVSIENLADPGGLTLTPLWIGFHDGNFDIGTSGESAVNFGGLEEIAEEGAVDTLRARFAADSDGVDAVLAAPGGFGGAPVIEPGESSTSTVDVNDPRLNQYFSYASMVIPSNDAFIGNLNEKQFQVFDDAGRFRRPVTIYVFGRNIYDAGTEVNDPAGGAAFSTEGGDGVTENGVITRLTNLDAFVGTGTPTGDLDRAFRAGTPIAKITISLAGSNVAGEAGRPNATADITSITTAEASVEVTAEITDPSGVDVSQLQASDFIVVRRGGDQLIVTNVVTDVPQGETRRTARASFTIESPTGATFNAQDNGDYRVVLRRDAVADGNGVANRNIDLGLLTVNL